MLNRISMTAVFLLMSGAMPLRAQFTVKDYRQFSGDDTGKLLIKTYVKGLGEGIMIANLEAQQKKVSLYCAPLNLAVKPDNYLDILDRQIKKLETNGMPAEKLDALPLSIPLMQGLQATFPCQGVK